MYMPPEPVSAYGETKINCSVDEEMDPMPQWNILTKYGTEMAKRFNITNGSESELTSTTRSARPWLFLAQSPTAS